MSEFKINFLKYNKKRGNFDDESLTLPGKSLETIVETCRDYARILESQANDMNGDENARRKLTFQLKAKECIEIADKIAEKIGYCKDCANARKKNNDDIGADAMTLMANGYKH